jgi:hypothetical protein
MTRTTLLITAAALALALVPASAGAQAPPPPVAGASVNVAPVKGTVLVQCPGEPAFTRLTAPRQIPLGCDVDTRKGTVGLTSARTDGALQSGEFWDGLVHITQEADFAVLTLQGPLDCASHDRSVPGGRAAAARRRGRGLWGTGKGRFRIVGRRGSASARGTTWETADTCADTTAFRVTESVVDVRDFVKNRTVAVSAGKTYVAGTPKASVVGPSTVRVGQLVTFQAAGLGSPILVVLVPAANLGGNCCSAVVRDKSRPDFAGNATVRFRWPSTYSACAGASNCRKVKWARGSKVVVQFSGASGFVRKTVKLRP